MQKVKAVTVIFMLLGSLCLTLFARGVPAEADRGAGVAVQDLPEGIRHLDIKSHFVPSTAKETGKIVVLGGSAVVVHGDTEEAYFAAEGDPLFEHDSINTLAESRCRIRFSTDDVVTMGPESSFSIEEFNDQSEEGKKTSVFSMLTGKIKFYALKLLRYRESKFKVNTPTAVIGVRGTRFIVHVHEGEGNNRASFGKKLAASGNEMAPYMAELSSGEDGICTDTYIKDGCVEVNGVEVCAGQMSLCQGPAQPMPEEVWNQLECAVDPDRCRGEKGLKGEAKPDDKDLPEMMEEQVDRTIEQHHPEKERKQRPPIIY